MTKVSFDVSGSHLINATLAHKGNKPLNPADARELGGKLFSQFKEKGVKDVVINADHVDAATAAHVADGFLRASYTFNKYKTTPQNEGPGTLHFITPKPQEAEGVFAPLRTTTESAFWASDLVNEPANVLNPASYAERVRQELAPLGIKVTVLQDFQMKMRGMGAALAVGQGSKTPPCIVVLEYDGTNGEQKRPLGLVGKGLTFDSGGISIKPGAGMGNMTMDMAGSAAVAGAMRALAQRGAKAHVVAVLGLAENMPGPDSMRPGDIVKSMSGKTIYVDNTDAEGRLVLCDAITYIQKEFDPHTVVDIATLTGSASAALGKEFAAAFSNNQLLMERFNRAANASGERIWPMPLTESPASKKAVENTPHADLTNSAAGPGALTAAAFLHQFIEKNADGSDKRHFMHLDIAGPGIPATELKGWGVYLFDKFVRSFCEQAPAVKQKGPQVPNPPSWAGSRKGYKP
jgi:leucyl aminopeptidase